MSQVHTRGLKTVFMLVKDWRVLILTRSHSFQEKMSLADIRCSETQNAPTWVLHWLVSKYRHFCVRGGCPLVPTGRQDGSHRGAGPL